HASARCRGRESAFGYRAGFNDDLQILEIGAVVELDEVNSLAIAPGLHPAVNFHLGAERLGEDLADVAHSSSRRPSRRSKTSLIVSSGDSIPSTSRNSSN